MRRCLLHSGEFPNTVLFKVPGLRFEYVTDEDIASHMEKIFPSLEYVPLDETIEHSKKDGPDLPGVKKSPCAKPNKMWIEIAKILTELGYVPLSALYAQLGNLSPWLCRKIVSQMERQGLIELCPLSLGQRGNPKTYVVLRPKGAEFIGVEFDKIRLPGRGSTEHVILQNLLAGALRDSGKNAAIEHEANGKAVDVAVICDDGATAYEIELEPAHPHLVENVLRDLEVGFDEVVILTRNQAGQNEAKDKVYKSVAWEKLSRVKFKLLREFL